MARTDRLTASDYAFSISSSGCLLTNSGPAKKESPGPSFITVVEILIEIALYTCKILFWLAELED
jgi:hypothetical protein